MLFYMERIALTLPGGGARAAYQAGVLHAISEICKFKESPFQIISGVSAGAINGMGLAAGSEDFSASTTEMWDVWKNLSVDDIYKTDVITLAETGLSWLKDLSLGQWFGKTHSTYLLDTSPLEKLLKDKINFSAIQKNLDSGLLYGLSLSTTDYQLGVAITFFSGNKDIQPWNRTFSKGQRDELTIKHILASTALPIFFPPVHIAGREYGDGGVGLKTPLSPAIHMGATRLLVIGVQNPKGGAFEKHETKSSHTTLGDISGTLLNALFLSSLDIDIERMQRINRTISLYTPEQLKKGVDRLRQIPMLVIHPSRDLSCIGAQEFAHFPFTIRHLLKGFGVTDQKGWDLLSYLAFDKVYSQALLELGYQDAFDLKNEIINFFKV